MEDSSQTAITIGAALTRDQLEHLIRASATIADDDEIVVVGSQAVLGQFPDAPEELCRSMEADLWPRNHPERWELIDGSINDSARQRIAAFISRDFSV